MLCCVKHDITEHRTFLEINNIFSVEWLVKYASQYNEKNSTK